MSPTVVIVIFLLAILAALGSGLFFLVSDGGDKRRTVMALTLRIGLSLALILFLVIGYLLGWIHPHGIVPR
jgi:hypothetical protein